MKISRRGSVGLYVLFSLATVFLLIGIFYFRYRKDLQRYQNPWVPARGFSRFHPRPVYRAAHREPHFVITGALKNRSIVYKVLPSYPQWAEEQGFSGRVRLSFRVSEAGEVYPNIWVTQTGYPDFDDAAIKALKHWKFAPAKKPLMNSEPGDITPETTPGQGGTISFNFMI